jgi:hypothetical protein
MRVLCVLILSAGLVLACPDGQYPDEKGTCTACPAHTTAAAATCAHDCRCEPGFLCMYYRQVHATVTLNTTLHDFENDHNGVRSSLVSGVAAAAGVVPEQVHIHYVVIRLAHRRRRLLGASIQVSLVVSGTSGQAISGLRRHLSGLQTHGDSWEVRKRVSVLAIPGGRQRELAVAVEQNT